MKAVVIEQYGGKEQLNEIEVPTPEINQEQVLIEIHSTSINPIDWKVREGYLKEMLDWNFPIILGWDVSGTIKEVGDQVEGYQVGDRVFARPATTPNGTYAEYVAVEQDLLAHMPERLSFEDAAAVPLAGLTAWQCLFDAANVEEGDKVLIHAGSGGVGSYAIQLAKWAGAYVATTASGKNGELVKALGADHFINYKEENFYDVLDEFDVVLDTLGGDIQEQSYQVLRKGGKLVSITDVPDEDQAKEYGVEAEHVFLNPKGEQLQQIAHLISEGKVKSIVGHKFPFSEQGLKDAHELSETHHAQGKIVIQMKPSAC
ncbi:NADP-dependent oxidoreductase [Pontibacillus salipaludis]|uniref:NADPH:quinone reductase n=1 Tax=Pontibacillus salipaludis TaxID=1697394 RepID=A0ABQ1PQX0_9BACI|nr:NADP-dependent oxidoreductase [Pontibacillus salipaludis]GGD01436.1 NADPH:quinone reductase [Pontibacillus salipaludis]